MTDTKKTFTRIGLALIAAYAVLLAFGRFVLTPLLTAADLEKVIETIGPSLTLLLTYIPNLIFLLVFWLVIRTIPKSEWKGEPMRCGALVQIFVMMYAVSGVLNLVGISISKASPAGGTEQLDMINRIVTSGLVTGILMTVVIAPVVEELIFRKFMLDRIRNYGEKTAIVFSALCFGLFHGNLTQFLFAFTAGLFLGYVYCKTGKVHYTMIMHALLNAAGASVMLLASGMEQGNAVMLFLLSLMVLTIAVMLIAGFVQLVRHLKRRDMRLDSSMMTAIPSGDVLKTVYLNPCMLVFMAFCTAEIVMGLLKISL